MELGQRLLTGAGDERMTIQTTRQYACRFKWRRTITAATANIAAAVITNRTIRIRSSKRVAHGNTACTGDNADFQDLAGTRSAETCVHRIRHHKVGFQTGRCTDVVEAMCGGAARNHGETQPVGQTRELFHCFHRVELLTIIGGIAAFYTRANGTEIGRC